MSGSAPALLYRRDAAVASLVFNRPAAMNAIDEAVAQAFLAACEQIAADPEVRAVVLSGAGRAFVAGGDLHMLASSPDEVAARLIDPMHRGLALLAAHPAPLIASVHGSAAGAGMSLVLACDLAIAARGTRFCMAYLRIGASCDLGASWTLPRVVGPRKAAELALLNPTIDADEALRLGMLNEVVEPDELETRTREIVARITQLPQPAAGQMKQLLRGSADRDFVAQLQAERESFHACATGEGFGDRIRSFVGDRTPVR